MFPDPTEAGLLGPGLFHDRTGIDVGLGGDAWRQGCDFFFELGESPVHHRMVILAPGVTGDAPHSRLLVRTIVCVVVHSDRDHRSTARQDELGVASTSGVASHPGHCAVDNLAGAIPQDDSVSDGVRDVERSGREDSG